MFINIYQNKIHHKRKAKIGICLRAIHKARQKKGKIFILFTNNLSKSLRDKIISVSIIHGISKHSLLNYNYLLIMITQSSDDLISILMGYIYHSNYNFPYQLHLYSLKKIIYKIHI